MGNKKKKKSTSAKKNPVRSSADNSSDSRTWKPFSEVLDNSDERQKLIKDLGGLGPDNLSVIQIYRLAVNHLIEGLMGKNDSEFDAGINSLLVLTQKSEPYLPALMMLSWVSCFSDVVTEPMNLLDKALSLTQDSADLKRYKVIQLYRSGNTDDALKCLEELANSSGWSDQDSEIADQLKSGSDFPQGSGFLIPSLDFGSLHHLKKPHESYQINFNILCKLIDREPENIHLLFETSLHAFFLGLWSEAESLLNRLLKLSPVHSHGNALLGFVCEKRDKIDEAVEHYKKVLAEDPHHPLANVNSGICCRHRGNIIGAEYYFQKAVESAPEFPEALSQWARCLVHDEDNSEKILDLHKKALLLDPDVSEYHLHYCLSILRLGDISKLHSEWNLHKKYIQAFTENDSARRLINRVLAGSRDPLQDVALAEMLNENGFHSPARNFIVKAWKRKYNVGPEKLKEFFYHAGLQASSCEEHSISLEAFQNLQELDPKAESVSIYIAMAYARLGKNREALDLLEGIEDESGRLGILKSNIYWDLGRTEEAVEANYSVIDTADPSILSLYYAIKYSLSGGYTNRLAEFITHGEMRWKDTPGFWALKAETLLSEGKSSEAADYLKEKLYQNGSPALPQLKEKSGLENDIVEPFYILGCSLLKQLSFDDLDELLDWLDKIVPGAAEWEVLRAERYRAEKNYTEALAAVSPTNRSLLAYMTRALCYNELENLSEVQQNCSKGLRFRKGKMYYHPVGEINQTLEKLLEKVGAESEGSLLAPGS